MYRFGDRNNKNRYIWLEYIFKKQKYPIMQLSFNITTKIERRDVFKVAGIERETSLYNDGELENKTLLEAIEYARESINNKLTKMREDELPAFIKETKELFAEIINSMERGEDVLQFSYLRNLKEEYDRLRNRY